MKYSIMKSYTEVIDTKHTPEHALTVERVSLLIWAADCRMIDQIALLLTPTFSYSLYFLP